MEEEEEEGWGWVYQWGIYPFMPSVGTLWRVEVGMQGPTAQRGTLGFYKSTTASRKIWKTEWTGGPRRYKVRSLLLCETISLMEHIRYCRVDEKGQILPEAVQAAAMLKGQSSKLFCLHPSVTEKVPLCVLFLRRIKSDIKTTFLLHDSVSSFKSGCRHFITTFQRVQF